MRRLIVPTMTIGLLAAASLSIAQRPGSSQNDGPETGGASDLVTRMMKFDSNQDGKLTRSEITDDRLKGLFDRSDANKDGTVTKEELTAIDAKDRALDRDGPGGPFGGGPGGPGGRFGGPPGGGPPGGFMMEIPRPGEILSRMLQQRLRLTDTPREDLNDLQKDVDAKLAKILNAEQRTILKEMRDRGPGRFGPPGGRRPGGPGFGPPPGGGGPPPPPPGDGSPPPPPDQN